jgi:dTDP-4-dehydrorhamnose 3,5-epimerase-like enzyme
MTRPIRSPLPEPAALGDDRVSKDRDAGPTMRQLTPNDLDPARAERLTTQSYTRRPAIEGVKLIELKRFTEDGGSFTELLRVQKGAVSGLEGFEVAQVNYSDMEPGAIKAWHVHFRQEDLWFVPPVGKLLVGLLDLRKGSSSLDVSQRFVMGDGRAQLLLIPRGVAHGVANLSAQRQILMYFVNSAFCAEEPDEHRLDPFLLGRAFWEMQAG